MAIKIYGAPLLFGICEPMPLVGFPPGRARIRMRPTEFARVFIKSSNGIQGFYVEVKDGAMTPGKMFGAKQRT
jgi:hypothetical protein